MPFSTNAPFNERGYAEVLRDIEYHQLKIQELFKAAGINDGDLNPGGGQGVSQDIADDSWGSPPDTADADAVKGLLYTANMAAGPFAWTVPSGLFNADYLGYDDLGGWDPTASAAASVWTAPSDGVYAIDIQAYITLAGATVGQLINLVVDAVSSFKGQNPPGITIRDLRAAHLAADSLALRVSLTRPFLAGDTVTAYITMAGGSGTYTLTSSSQVFSATKIRGL
jgi:hypothetical protein